MLLNMAVKIALAVGLFIVFCVLPGTKSSQVVPDGLVYTEVKKTLVRGAQGVLTCRFHGDPLAVYWKRGLDDLRTMVSWIAGEVLGPRYDDGSCDLGENYSLIINNVSTADAGRIHCTVVNYKGVLIKNYTDILVADTVITTNPQVTLQLRQSTYGILQCTVHIKARRVSWKKGITSSANGSFVVIENNQGVAERSGAGYDDGTYNITQDYSLVIKEVQVHHEGLYVCEVTDDTGLSFRNHTFANVIAQPLEPFPTIQECLNAEQHDSNYCTLVAKSGTTLTCQAAKYYPSINLVFIYGSRALEPSDKREWDNIDGTKNKTITIATRGNKELYTCVASSIPGTNANKSTSVLLQGDEPGNSTALMNLMTILGLFAALILITSVAYFFWRRAHHIVEVKALEQRVNDKLMQHYRIICNLIGPTSAIIQTEKIIKENRTALFNTHQMMTDVRERTISTRVEEMIDKENEPADDWPSNEELKTISRHLTQESMKEICKKLNIDCKNDDANDEGKRFERLHKWRTNVLNKSLVDKYRQLAPVFESNNLGGLLPTFRRPYIYKAELVDMAFHLLMHDLYPIAKQLGINATKLVSYRPAFDPSHLEIGTIKLLIDPFEPFESTKDEDKRVIFSRKIANHYTDISITGILEYDMSYGELCSISEAINQNLEEPADQEATSGMLQGPGISESLQNVLQLTAQDIAEHLDTPHPLTAYALLKMWKEKPRPSVFNYRAALAHEIRRNMMPDLADEIAAGKYMKKRTSLAFIEDMVSGLNQDQLSYLVKLLKLNGTDGYWPTNTPSEMISKQIYDWVADWTTEMEIYRKSRPRREHVKTGETLTVPSGGVIARMTKSTMESQLSESNMLLDHRDFNDRLVEHGFLDLAREIMIIEQRSVAGLFS
ncbi:uncharacterized protein LOC115928430 [Strongylocentrotus purpuratus]|uniref:Ig-like domain-containing protein n=1 Tax=Strongylocentrotus purpuratus TaxID=7668 RepID=A0A7M7PHT7_STRPU|nr:uncharacterized protein LOC115928430 [Strongylocentrotus purpuratus]